MADIRSTPMSSPSIFQGPKPELGVPYYGTRFGHNLVHQIKQKMVDLNITKVIMLTKIMIMMSLR